MEHSEQPTKRAPQGSGWSIDDAVVRLRLWATESLERLQAIRFSGLSDLEDSIRRVVAMRTWGVTAGAKRLGLKHSSLSQWARSRKRRLCT